MAAAGAGAGMTGDTTDFAELLLSVLDQTSFRMNLRDDEGRFVAFSYTGPEILPVRHDETVGRSSWNGGQYLRADGRERSILDHPAQEARRTGIAQLGERLGLRFPNGEEHWVQGDFLPLSHGPSGYEVLSVLHDTTVIENERREAVELAAALRQALAVSAVLASQASTTPRALAELVRSPLMALLPGCHVALGLWPPDGQDVHLVAVNELAGMTPFESRARRSPDVRRRVPSSRAYVDNELSPTDIVGRRAIGTDVVPARSVCLVPFPAEDEHLGVMVIYNPRPGFFTPGLVAALEALAPVLSQAILALDPGWEMAA